MRSWRWCSRAPRSRGRGTADSRLVLDDLVDDTLRLRLRVDGDPPHAEVGEDVQEELRVVRVAPVGAGRRVAAARAGVGHGAVPVGPRRRHELGVAQQQHVGRAHDARVVAALDERVDRGAGRVRGSSPDLAHARGDPFRGLPGGEAVGRRSEVVMRQDQELLAPAGEDADVLDVHVAADGGLVQHLACERARGRLERAQALAGQEGASSAFELQVELDRVEDLERVAHRVVARVLHSICAICRSRIWPSIRTAHGFGGAKASVA